MEIAGSKKEKQEFADLLQSPKAELVAVTGRRRVGKTYLIRNYFAKNMEFESSGILNASLAEHLVLFTKSLQHYYPTIKETPKCKNWFDAFDALAAAIAKQRSKKKKVLFFDELPWMGMSHISFKKAFSNFWNNFATRRTDLIIFISGSSTSWMYHKIFGDKGGLYQRVTKRIYLQPFTLLETAQFLAQKKLLLSRAAIVELYMIMGGIPFYLDLVKQGESVVQAIDRLFFSKSAELQTEFTELASSLFGESLLHKKTISLLANHTNGLYRNELLAKLKTASGGQYSNVLEELELSGFINSYTPYGNSSKFKKYKLTDAYTLFYHRFVKGNTNGAKWTQLVKTQQWKSWSGLAFENVCKTHIEQIKEKLKISGILSATAAWNHIGNTTMHGAQIDLLLDRDDNIINLCEIKYYNTAVTITKPLAEALRKKIAAFQYFTKTTKTIHPIIITTYGLHHNTYSNGFIQHTITINDLFEKA